MRFRRLEVVCVLFVVVLAFAMSELAMAKVPPCTETVQYEDNGGWSSRDSACTFAQLRAWDIVNTRLEDEGSQWRFREINGNAGVRRLYLAYLDLVYKGYTPNDAELNSAETAFRDAALAAGIFASTIGDLTIGFRLSDVFPGYWHDIDGVLFRGDRRTALDWVVDRLDCGMPFCDPSDRVVRLLGGGDSNKESLFVDNGFRVTGAIDTDYTSFGLWAQDSYWGFWQSEIRNRREATGVSGEGDFEFTAYAFVDGTDTLFIAGGRNPQKPRYDGTWTWQGLAVGKHKLLPDVRVGRSEIVVDFEANEVDVTISGLVFGGATAASVNGQQHDIESGNILSWKGLSLMDDGSFRDPRQYGLVSNLDDVFAGEVPIGGVNYYDTADTLRGQFHGDNGNEVVGVFNKQDIEGSFGAYR